jgi:gamma-glutamyltranspeptidase/glutathione hydrolase
LLSIALSGCSAHRRASDGVVSAATPEAACAGAEILSSGGNAIDAAVATAFTLAVTEAFGSGVGGQIAILVHPTDGEPFVINGTSRAPLKLPLDPSTEDLKGRRATTVPSTIKTLAFAFDRYGSGKITWKEAIQPAIRCATDGYHIGPYQHRVLKHNVDVLRHDDHLTAVFLNPDGSVPAAGSRWTQPRLGALLGRLATAGPDDFYRGELARDIASDMLSHGGLLSARDLESLPDPQVVPALRGYYREWDVYTLPPPYGGWAVLHALSLLQKASRRELADVDTRDVWIARALQRTHWLRDAAPIHDLRDYSDEVDAILSPRAIAESWTALESDAGGETTHFTIVDERGLVVSVSASINDYFGAKVLHPRRGFLYNDYMREFTRDRSDHPFFLRPGGMPYSSMGATILSKNGRPHLALGSPGSKRIVSTVVQVVSRWVDDRKNILQAVSAPRLHVELPDRLWVENEAIAAEVTALAHQGLAITRRSSPLTGPGGDPYFGGVHAVAFERGVWRGAADPRRDGTVVFAAPRH